MAGTEVGSLYYDLTLDDNNLKQKLADSNKTVQSFGDKVSAAGEKISAGLRTAAKDLAAVGVGLTAYAKNAVDFTENFVKSSKALGTQIGVSTTEASRLTAAFQRMGIEGEQAQQMFGIFSKQISASTTNATQNNLALQKLQLQVQQTKNDIRDITDEVKKNGDKSGDLTLKLKVLNNQLSAQQDQLKQNSDSFQRLGITTTDASGKQKDFNTVLFEVADKFKAMPNGVDKTTIALDLFGRSGKDMIKVLNLGSDGIAALEKQADKLGLTLTADTIVKINNLIKSQKDLKEQTDALKIAVGTATAPYLTAFNKKMNEVVIGLMSAENPLRKVVVQFLAFGGPVATASAGLAGFLGNISSISKGVGKMVLGLSAFVIIMGLIAIVLNDVVKGMGGWKAVIDKLQPSLNGLKDWFVGLKDNAVAVIDAIERVADAVADYLWPKIDALIQTIATRLLPVLADFWHNYLEPLIRVLGPIVGVGLLWVIGAVVDIINGLITAFSKIIDWINTNKPIIEGLAVTFGILAAKMAFDGVANAIILAFNRITLVAIPNLMASWTAMTTTLVTPIVIPALVIGAAIASINTIKGAWDAVLNAQNAASNIGNDAQVRTLQKQAAAARAIGDQAALTKITNALKALGGNASGTNNWPGGFTWVGERGPEIVNLPKGSEVIPNHSSNPGGNSYHIEHLELSTPSAVREFFAIGDRNTQLETMGMSPLVGA